MQKPRILFAYKHYARSGGAEKNLLDVASDLAELYDVCFVLTGGDNDERITALGEVLRFPSRGNPLLIPLDILYLAWTCWRRKIKVIHSHHRYPAFIASLASPLVAASTLTTVHNVFPDKSSFSRWGDRLIAVSERVRQWLIEDCEQHDDTISVVYNGVEVPSTLTDDVAARLAQEFGISDDACILCSVGRLSEQKNYGMLMECLSLLRSRDWLLILVGDGEQREHLQELAADRGIADRVRFTGYRTDVSEIMQLSDIYLMTSRWEGFPYVIIEAMANRLPVISTDVGGVREAVHDGENGRIVPADDVGAFVTAIDDLMTDDEERERLSRTGLEIFMSNFTDEIMYSKTRKIYRELLAGGD